MKAATVVLAAVAVASAASNAPVKSSDDGFELVLLPLAADGSGARCLDGSAAGYYKRPGVGAGAAVVLIELEGGGWCVSEEDCKARAMTDLGSSKNWPTAGCPGMDGGANGLLSRDCTVNPQFCNATAIHVNCTWVSPAPSVCYARRHPLVHAPHV
jgi:hypothetical protein